MSEISIRKSEKDGSTRMEIEKIENGYILTVNKDYKDKKGIYQYETKRTYYKENPLDEAAKENGTISETIEKFLES